MRSFLFKLTACVLLVAMHSHCYAQEMPENATSKEILIFIMQQKHSNPELAKKYAEILLEKSKKEQQEHGVFNAYMELSRIANIEGNYTLAIKYADTAIASAKKLENDFLKGVALLVKGNANVYLGDNKKALENYLQANEISKKEKELELSVRARANIAKVKRRMGFYKEALDIYKENAALAEENTFEDRLIGINSYMGIGGTFLRLHQPDSTLHYAEIGLQKSLQINDDEGVSYFYIDIGIAYFIKGDFDMAIDYLEKAEKITKGLNNQKRLTEIYYYIGKSYNELEEQEKAVTFFKKVEAIVTEINTKSVTTFNPPELLGTYRALANLYENLGNDRAYATYTQKFFELNKYNESENIEVIKDLYETVRKENDDLSSRTSTLESRLIYVIFFAFCALALCVFILYKLIKARKQNKVIFEKLVSQIEEKKAEKQEASKKPEFTIEDKKVEEILQRLEKLEENLFFLSSNCTLQSLAKKVKTNTTYLSKIISTYKEKKFYEYINELRIEYVLKRLKEDSKFRKYSIKHIAEEIGYKSTNSFTKYFKAHTKLYPSYYIKNLENNEEENASN